MSDDEASTIIRELLESVEYIHMKDILHRDIKPENILLHMEDGKRTLKLADFGLSV